MTREAGIRRGAASRSLGNPWWVGSGSGGAYTNGRHTGYQQADAALTTVPEPPGRYPGGH